MGQRVSPYIPPALPVHISHLRALSVYEPIGGVSTRPAALRVRGLLRELITCHWRRRICRVGGFSRTGVGASGPGVPRSSLKSEVTILSHMGAPNTGGVAADAQAIRGVLAEIERAAVLDTGQWADKRDKTRRRINTPCTVRYAAPDGDAVLSLEGQTRDISGGGLGFVSSQHFRRGAPLYIMVSGKGGQTKRLTGTVVYSRLVQERWYLTGVKFVPIGEHDPALQAGKSRSAQGAGLGAGTRPPRPPKGLDEEQTQNSSRERTLRFLTATSSSGVTSNTQIDKIIVLSSSDDHVIRRATIPALMQIRSPAGRLGLESLLNDPNSQIQVDAAEALGGIGARETIESLKELLKHKKPEVALRVATVLGRLGDKSGIAVVRRYLPKDNPHTRAAARALGVIVGRKFRLNSDGITEARRYLKKL